MRDMSEEYIKQIDLDNWFSPMNEDNFKSYGELTDEDNGRQNLKNTISTDLAKTNWKSESDYFNSYHRKPKGRAIKCNNKEYLKRLNNV